MKVFVQPIGLHSTAMLRVAHALEQYAPNWVTIVHSPNEADVIVSHVIDADPPPDKPEIIIQYCYKTTRSYDWQQRWSRAVAVWSYYDLPQGPNGFPFYHAPLGVDAVFTEPFVEKLRDFDVMTSGFVSSPKAEAIEEVSMVAWMLGLEQVHLGPKNVAGMQLQVDLRTIQGVGDSKLASYYRRCKWVSGLRHIEGFELPVIEGLCCGARPIVFDRPEMRQWYNGHAVFIPECSGTELVKYLLDVLADDPEPVSRDERQWAIDQFRWEPIIKGLWTHVGRATFKGSLVNA